MVIFSNQNEVFWAQDDFLVASVDDIKHVDEEIYNSMMWIKNNNIEIVKLLVSKNVDLNVTDQYGLTPFNYAVDKGLYTISEMLKPFLSYLK